MQDQTVIGPLSLLQLHLGNNMVNVTSKTFQNIAKYIHRKLSDFFHQDPPLYIWHASLLILSTAYTLAHTHAINAVNVCGNNASSDGIWDLLVTFLILHRFILHLGKTTCNRPIGSSRSRKPTQPASHMRLPVQRTTSYRKPVECLATIHWYSPRYLGH